jgi:hypothetical protein
MRLFTAAFVALSVAELAYFTAFGLSGPGRSAVRRRFVGAGPTGIRRPRRRQQLGRLKADRRDLTDSTNAEMA